MRRRKRRKRHGGWDGDRFEMNRQGRRDKGRKEVERRRRIYDGGGGRREDIIFDTGDGIASVFGANNVIVT